MNDRDPSLLEDMLENAEIAIEAVRDLSVSDFSTRITALYTTLHAVQLIGEAARKLSDQTKARLPNIPWRDVVGTRNIIVHEYRSVDPAIVYAIAKERLPELAEAVAELLKEAPPP